MNGPYTHPFEHAVYEAQAAVRKKQRVAEKKANCAHHRRMAYPDKMMIACLDCGEYRTHEELEQLDFLYRTSKHSW